MNDDGRGRDPLAVASDVSLTIAGSPGQQQMLTAVARRIAEALGVWECDLYEYRPESDEFAALAIWAVQMSDADRAFVGTRHLVTDLPSCRRLFNERVAVEYQLDDPTLGAKERATLERWGSAASSTCRWSSRTRWWARSRS